MRAVLGLSQKSRRINRKSCEADERGLCIDGKET